MTIDFDRTEPSGAVKYFRHCILSGDQAGALSCFDKDATYIERDGREVKGLDNIKKSMEQLCNWKPAIKGLKQKVVIVGDYAVWTDKWILNGLTPDGKPIEITGATSCMMKRNENGIWLWLVDNPFAADVFE